MADRLPDWRPRLTRYVLSTRACRFAWGTHDCATFAAGAVAAMTGAELRADFGNYTTRIGAKRALLRNGFDTVADVADAHFPRCPRHRARPGDLAAIETEDGVALAVVQGPMIYVVTPEFTGLVSKQTACAFWRVG